MSEKVVTGYVIASSFEKLIRGDFGCISIYRNYNRKGMVKVELKVREEESKELRMIHDLLNSPYSNLLTDDCRKALEERIAR